MSVIDEKELREYLEEKTKEELINQVILQTRTYERALNTIVDKREIIDKAIEYMEQNMIEEPIKMYDITQIDVQKLLDILDGKEAEDNE